MSEGRGLTLRKKRKDRPTISGPQPTGASSAPRPAPQQNKAGSSLAPPRERNAPSETSDLVKRRYSTRYNQLPDFSNLDNPPVPSLPGALKRSSQSGSSPRRRSRPSGGSHPLQVDQDALSDPNLSHERYVTNLLSNASEHDIQEYQNSLRKIKNRTSTNLQQSVYQNRTQFIKISKEAEKLKSEMQVLRGLMSDLTGALSQTNSSANGTLSPELSGSAPSRRNPNRTSVANLESMWNIQLQTLWKNVEKSQKFLPAVPGRHIITENGAWVELDSATWKPKRPIHLVLLNDHLLVASKKRKRMDPNVPQQGPAPTKLVAEECWPLQDIDMVDMSAAGVSQAEERAIATAITVRAGNRSLTYRSEKRDPKAKTEMMQTFRKAVEDLRKANKIDSPTPRDPQSDSLNYFASRDPASAGNADILSSLSNTNSKHPEILIDVDGQKQNFRWIESQLDELDIDIALQRIDPSVASIEKLRNLIHNVPKSNTIVCELLTLKLDERANKLAAVLIRDIVDKPSFMENTKRTVSYLARLGKEDRARNAYLEARTEVLNKRSRQCVFEGDMHLYIFQLSYVYFTIIKNTVMIYQASFNKESMSAVIQWSNGHLEAFNSVLQRQMSSVEKGSKVWRECMDVVWGHERGMLRDEGLDLREVIGRGLELPDTEVSHQTGGEVRDTRSGSRGGMKARSGSRGGSEARSQSRPGTSRAAAAPGAWPSG
jgi:exocyst complex component 8